MDRLEIEREEKRNFLQTHIIENNYDSEDFLNYLTKLRGEDGVDIDNWKFNELKKVK